MGQTRITLADDLLKAALDIDRLSRRDLQALLRRAALRIRNERPRAGFVVVDADLLEMLDVIIAENDGDFTRDQVACTIMRDWGMEHDYLQSGECSDLDDKAQ